MAAAAERVALVTGASSGIGRAVVRQLATAGWRVVAAARRLERLQELAAELGEACHPLQLDLTRPASVAGLEQRLPEPFRQLDALVNNAGLDLGRNRPFEECAIEDSLATVRVNLDGMLRVTREVLSGMVARGRGDIVNVGSIAARQDSPTLAVYAATKHAVHGFSRALRAEHRQDDIRVVEIVPGVVESEFALSRWRGDADRAADFYRGFPAVLTPEDVARCVGFALAQPPGVTIAELLVLPTRQA